MALYTNVQTGVYFDSLGRSPMELLTHYMKAMYSKLSYKKVVSYTGWSKKPVNYLLWRAV